MESFQRDFMELAVSRGVLKFGSFELKSGRTSPYFFNAGSLASGADLSTLGQCYAAEIVASGLEYDLLFGPAYKGIPLVAATAIALAEHHGVDKPYCYNRKEAKGHGEGGLLVGAPLEGRVLVIDDVITAGTAIREVLAIIQQQGADVAGAVVGLDRKEKGASGNLSAVQDVEQSFGFQVLSIVDIDDIIEYLQGEESLSDNLPAVVAYRERYGVS